MRWILALVFVAGSVTWATAQDDPGVLTVNGQGQVVVVPDMAVLTLGVREEATTAEQALRQSGEALRAMFKRLAEAGIAERDMQTSELSLSPLYERTNDNRPPRVIGFVASNMLTVRLRDIDGIGGVLDRVVRSGANTFRGLRLAVQSPRPLEDEARRAAVQDAVAKATLYAEAAGVSLGRIKRIQEAGGSSPGPRFEAAMMARDSVPIAEGEVSVSMNVTIEFELVQ